MLPLRHEKRWRIASFALLLAVLAAALAPQLTPHFPSLDWALFDKWLHALTFLILALWFSGQYPRSSYWRIAIGLTAFGVLIEVCQGMVSYRMAEWNDLFADMFGTGLGLIAAVAGLGGWSLRFERWLKKETVRGE